MRAETKAMKEALEARSRLHTRSPVQQGWCEAIERTQCAENMEVDGGRTNAYACRHGMHSGLGPALGSAL